MTSEATDRDDTATELNGQQVSVLKNDLTDRKSLLNPCVFIVSRSIEGGEAAKVFIHVKRPGIPVSQSVPELCLYLQRVWMIFKSDCRPISLGNGMDCSDFEGDTNDFPEAPSQSFFQDVLGHAQRYPGNADGVIFLWCLVPFFLTAVDQLRPLS